MDSQRQRRRVTKSSEARRQDILDAGRRVFDERGFESASIAVLAEAAAIGKGTFYLYFDSKDDLLGALWGEYIDEIIAIGDGILEYRDGDWWETLERLLSELVKVAVEHSELHRIVYGSGNARSLELCKSANQRVIEQIAGFVDDGAQAGAFRADQAAEAFRMVYHAIDGILDDLIGRREPLDVDAIIALVLDFARRALAPAG